MFTIVINMVGGSGLGKSTVAAATYAALKSQSESAELVREYVKEWAWQGKAVGPFGQSIIYGKQLDRESSLYGKVKFIVTDSPLILCPIYQYHYYGHDSIKYSVLKDLDTCKGLGVVHLNFLLKRNKSFDGQGRYESEKEAKLIDQKVAAFLCYHKVPYIDVDLVELEDQVKFIIEKAKAEYGSIVSK